MNDPNVVARMKQDWDERAREDAHYYVAFGRKGQDEAEFQDTAHGVVLGLEAELKRLKPGRPRARRALEIGCGPGRLLRPMSRHFGEIHGVDISAEMIRLAGERLSDVPHAHPHVTQGSDLAMFADESFDFVYSYAVFQHIPSREVVLHYLAEAYRVMREGGVLKAQINGLPESAQRYDTWSGVRIDSADIKAYLSELGFQLLALEGVSTQYMWVTAIKRSQRSIQVPTGVRIRRITNTQSSEPVAPAAGRFAAISLWVDGLPEEVDIVRLEAHVGGKPARLTYIGPAEHDGMRQVNAILPSDAATGLQAVDLTWDGAAICESKAFRIVPPPPAVPRIVAISDGIDLLSGLRIKTGSMKVTVEEMKPEETFQANVDGVPVLGTELFCTDPVPPRYEVNFQIPGEIPAGGHNLFIEIGRRKLAPIGFELVRTLALFVMVSVSIFAAGLTTSDLRSLRSVGDVKLSPDGSRIAYTISHNNTDGKPYSVLHIMNRATGAVTRIGKGDERSGGPDWSPDGKWIAYSGTADGKRGLVVAAADGTGAKWLAALEGTNNPLPSTGNTYTWSPDSKHIAFVTAQPGPETAEASGDPVVITRYLYKPDAGEGNTRFNDNKRLHIFIVDVSSGATRQMTRGNHYEHSVAWSPKGDEIAFVSNQEPNEDQFFNYDIFTLKVSDGSIRRITATESIEYRPVWSPDGKVLVYQGCKRGLTDLETTMEDTHIWAVNADGTNRREITGMIDNRQGHPIFNPEGTAIYFNVQERGTSHLYRLDMTAGAKPVVVVNDRGTVGGYDVGKGAAIAYSFTSTNDMAQLYLNGKKLTDLNKDVLAGKQIAETESLTFISNDNKFEVEAFLTKPLGMTATSKHPLIVVIHGGPHGQQGPAFNFRSQVYANKGWATLMVNYRGSTGYGQAFADGVFGDQNGNEGQDVLYGVSAAMRRYLWIDRDRIGVEGVSYGGQLSAWLITQTRLFKSAIPTAAIINLVSYNYTTYYNQYEQMTFGIFPHQGNLMDILWERSALKHVAKVATPTLMVHGENDNDVPISEAEQYYIALKDVGVETNFIRYPREGHGLREVKHVIDWTERSMKWHESHFPR